MSDLKRVNVKVSPEVYTWFKKRSENTGVPMSSLMFLALEQHIQQQILLPHVPEIIEKSRQNKDEE